MNKKIIFFASSTNSLVNFRYHLIKNFIDYGYVVIACAPATTKNTHAIKTLSDLGVKFIPLQLKNTSLNCFNDVFVIKKFLKIIKSEIPTIVFAYTIKPVIYASIAAKLAKINFVYSLVTGLGYIFIGNTTKIKILRFFVEKLYKFALKFNAKVFFQNPDDLNLFIEKNIVSNAKSVLINGSGVDIDFFIPVPFPEKVTFLFTGRLIKDKGIHEYIAAVKILKQRYPEIRFMLVGDCDPNPTSISKEDLQKIDDEKIIEYLGCLADVREALAQTSVFVLPSYREGTPRAVLEAMAVGRPIITTNAPGCRETVIDGVNGYLVPVRNIDNLVSAMEKFILQPDLIAIMGTKSRSLSMEKFDVQKVNQVIFQNMHIFKEK